MKRPSGYMATDVKRYVDWLEAETHRLQRLLDEANGGEQLGMFEQPQEIPTGVAGTLVRSGDPETPAMGGVRRDSPSTAREAAKDNYVHSGNQRGECLKVICWAGDGGLTFDEIRDLTGIYSADRRVSELKQAGFIVNDGRTRTTGRGSEAEVFVATEKGNDWFNRGMPRST